MLDSLNLLNFFLLAIMVTFILSYYHSIRKCRCLYFILIISILTTSTKILPATLVESCEAKTPVLNPKTLDDTELYYLHILGAGYSIDPSLPATSQLSQTTLARLVEAIRISKSLSHYKIVSSGYSRLNLESQASVVRRAAVELGIPAENCEFLPTPTNTVEEVKAFTSKFGKSKNVVVISDAMHLPRALMLYKREGVSAVGAPTNFKIKNGANDYNGISFPSLSSVNLMSDYLLERAKYWKDSF